MELEDLIAQRRELQSQADWMSEDLDNIYIRIHELSEQIKEMKDNPLIINNNN